MIPKLSRTEITEEGEDVNELKITVVTPKPDYSKLTVDELKFMESIANKVKYFDMPILEED